MKTYLYQKAFICLVVITLTACFSPWKGSETAITINLGEASNRTRLSLDNTIIDLLEHTVRLSGPSSSVTIHTAPGQTSVQAVVTPGRWEIGVEAFINGDFYAAGAASVEIKPGVNNYISITMTQAVGKYTVVINGDKWHTAVLTASIIGQPETLTYQWKQNSIDIPGEINSTYTVDDSDRGQFISVAVGGVESSQVKIHPGIALSDLAALTVLNEDYILIADVDLPTAWIPRSPFTGTFDGNGRKINLGTNFNGVIGVNSGLFGIINPSGKVMNLRLEGRISNPPSATYIGAVAGQNSGSIENVSAAVEITINSTATTRIGGIAGYNTGIIRNCYANIDIIANGNGVHYTGGITGDTQTTGAEISFCWADGSLSSDSVSACIGGITGQVQTGKIEYCIALQTGMIISMSISPAPTKGRIAGIMTSPGSHHNFANSQMSLNTGSWDGGLRNYERSGADFLNSGMGAWTAYSNPGQGGTDPEPDGPGWSIHTNKAAAQADIDAGVNPSPWVWGTSLNRLSGDSIRPNNQPVLWFETSQ